MPSGSVCCGGTSYCPSGTTCGGGKCYSGSGGSGGSGSGGSGSGGSGSGGGTSSGDWSCHDVFTGDPCNMSLCMNIKTCQAYYQAEGVKFPCSSCNDIIACDTAAANLCVQSNQSGGSGYDDSDDSSGCVLSGGDSRGSSAASLLALGGALALSLARRRRVRQSSVR
jgi:hypothetical protein